MKTTIKLLLSMGLLSGALLLGARDAHAGGLAAEPEAVEAAARTSLRKEIAAFKASRSDIVKKVRDVQGVKPEVYSKFQNPVPVAGRELQALGKDALLPMLDALAFDASQTNLSAREREALTLGMLAAVGEIRDARSLPVLRGVLSSRTKSDNLAYGAAGAMGKTCGAAEVKLLTELSAPGKPLQRAALFGLGECRTVESAKALVSALSGASELATQREIVVALGNIGSSWVWTALAKGDQEVIKRGLEVRTLATDPLLEVFVKNAALRTDASKALQKCDHPAVGSKIRAARDRAQKAGDETLVKELTRLDSRLAKRRSAR